jgi:hypothetical protein
MEGNGKRVGNFGIYIYIYQEFIYPEVLLNLFFPPTNLEAKWKRAGQFLVGMGKYTRS